GFGQMQVAADDCAQFFLRLIVVEIFQCAGQTVCHMEEFDFIEVTSHVRQGNGLEFPCQLKFDLKAFLCDADISLCVKKMSRRLEIMDQLQESDIKILILPEINGKHL